MSSYLAQGSHKWSPNEDAYLVSSMVEMHNVGHGFRPGYLFELERMLAQKLPGCELTVLHIELRIRTLKKDWRVVYDMIYGPHTFGFVWDTTRKKVAVYDDVWEAYVMKLQGLLFQQSPVLHFPLSSLSRSGDYKTSYCTMFAKDRGSKLSSEWKLLSPRFACRECVSKVIPLIRLYHLLLVPRPDLCSFLVYWF